MKLTVIKGVFTWGLITCFIGSGNAENLPKEIEGFSFEASYIGDNVNNLAGGIKTGLSYLGMANMMLTIDTKNIGLWMGGKFYVNAANTHGGQPSLNLTGDVQVLSNIEAGDHTFLQEVWYKQKLGRTAITIGLQDLNVEFANSAYGAFYLNSSFGILPIISNNFTASIFPLTTMGITCKWNASDKTTWVNAAYDGSPTNFDYNPYNLRWQLNSGDGLLLISELQKSAQIKNLPGVYKAGVYAHFHIQKNIPDSLINQLLGFYVYADQTVWEHAERSAGLFLQLGYTPSVESTNNFYFGSGINVSGVFNKKANDTLGLAVAHVEFTHDKRKETTFELSYQYRISQHIFIQPDVQYIIHPSGTAVALPNALTANFRFGFSI